MPRVGWESSSSRHEVWLRQFTSWPGNGKGKTRSLSLVLVSFTSAAQAAPPAEQDGEQLPDPIQGERNKPRFRFQDKPQQPGKEDLATWAREGR